MKYIILSLFVLVILCGVLLGAYNLAGRGFELPAWKSMPELTQDDIVDSIESNNISGILIHFFINSPVYSYKGYVFDDGFCLFEERVSTGQTKAYIEQKKAAGVEMNLSPEYIAIGPAPAQVPLELVCDLRLGRVRLIRKT